MRRKGEKARNSLLEKDRVGRERRGKVRKSSSVVGRARDQDGRGLLGRNKGQTEQLSLLLHQVRSKGPEPEGLSPAHRQRSPFWLSSFYVSVYVCVLAYVCVFAHEYTTLLKSLFE